jgi:serine phosphatase RsbU (regulator of sigma subunit)
LLRFSNAGHLPPIVRKPHGGFRTFEA